MTKMTLLSIKNIAKNKLINTPNLAVSNNLLERERERERERETSSRVNSRVKLIKSNQLYKETQLIFLCI